ncbi:MAG: hypothetical protein KatS3mg085_599 [Candidatus Dojkabacteria bacterium]|nr:MAG: hypothetical protein KatS3mg085_599 [Candidatus Dojkabacteria bacterium]
MLAEAGVYYTLRQNKLEEFTIHGQNFKSSLSVCVLHEEGLGICETLERTSSIMFESFLPQHKSLNVIIEGNQLHEHFRVHASVVDPISVLWTLGLNRYALHLFIAKDGVVTETHILLDAFSDTEIYKELLGFIETAGVSQSAKVYCICLEELSRI